MKQKPYQFKGGPIGGRRMVIRPFLDAIPNRSHLVPVKGKPFLFAHYFLAPGSLIFGFKGYLQAVSGTPEKKKTPEKE